jgi:hypothetical protein
MSRHRKTDTGDRSPPPSNTGEPLREVPDWHAGDGLLHWRGLSKHFRPDAVNARAILGEFQRAGWCESIENPPPEDSEILRSRLLETTVSNLNRVLNGWGLRFHARGKGARVWWEAVV